MKPLNPKPCRYFKKYKAIRKPTCGCKPCMDKFLAKNKATKKFVPLQLVPCGPFHASCLCD